jgi:hypothetical protein
MPGGRLDLGGAGGAAPRRLRVGPFDPSRDTSDLVRATLGTLGRQGAVTSSIFGALERRWSAIRGITPVSDATGGKATEAISPLASSRSVTSANSHGRVLPVVTAVSISARGSPVFVRQCPVQASHEDLAVLLLTGRRGEAASRDPARELEFRWAICSGGLSVHGRTRSVFAEGSAVQGAVRSDPPQQDPGSTERARHGRDLFSR